MQIQDLIQELSTLNDLQFNFFSVVPALFIIIQLPQALDWQLEQYANLILCNPIKDILVTEKLPKDLANDVLAPIKANLWINKLNQIHRSQHLIELPTVEYDHLNIVNWFAEWRYLIIWLCLDVKLLLDQVLLFLNELFQNG